MVHHREDRLQLPPCAWCGTASSAWCGRCKSRAYCSTACQRFDWKSGHQTACALLPPKVHERKIEGFTLYDIPQIARWAVDLGRWKLQRESKEFDFLLSKIPEESRSAIAEHSSWRDAKAALARELIVRRLAEVLTHGVWENTSWKHDEQTGRDYLTDRSEYIWTGNKYVTGNSRFPNFNFAIVESGDFLFVVSHPVGLTGMYAAPPLELSLQADPRVVYSGMLDALGVSHGGQTDDDHDGNCSSGEDCEYNEDDATEWPEDAAEDGDGIDPCADAKPVAKCDGSESAAVDEAEDKQFFVDSELLDICAPDDPAERKHLLRIALTGKMAYFCTVGQRKARQWSQVVLSGRPVGSVVACGERHSEESDERSDGPRRHNLFIGGVRQNRWRCDLHFYQGHCIVVCRGPPEEAHDPIGEFTATQAARFSTIDIFDEVLEHEETSFLDVPIMQLLPDHWHSDYIRACGGGERGETLRMNR